MKRTRSSPQPASRRKKSPSRPTKTPAARTATRADDFKPDLPRLLAALATAYPQALCALTHRNAFELAVATILSAQCTDARVNMVTPALFRAYPDAAALAQADPAAVADLIRSTGFFNNKTKSLIGFAQALVRDHGGAVPQSMEALQPLPGIGRKTANVILGTSFGIAAGVVVDTHVKRISHRLGLTDETDPEKIERDLMALLPQDIWIDFSHRLIWHGRKICDARKPRCGDCTLRTQCRYFHQTPPTPEA
ncbi:MAG: endonuclease III [Planctomycetota bacterium]